MELPPLHRLTANEREAGAREDADAVHVARVRELGEGTREQVVAGGGERPLPVHVPRGPVAAPQFRAVDHVVVDERRRVGDLDRNAAAQGALAVGRGQVHEQRTQALAPALSASSATRATSPSW